MQQNNFYKLSGVAGGVNGEQHEMAKCGSKRLLHIGIGVKYWG
jgi:hypothetical protein